MRTTGTLLYAVTSQTIEHLVRAGRPTSATFKVFNDFDSDDTTPEFSGTATVETYSQTLTASSGPSQANPSKINVTSTNVSTSRRYLISEGSRQEWISPVEVGSGYIITRHPLKNDYTTAATLVGATLTAAVSDSWAADLSNVNDQDEQNPGYRVRWEILVNGATTVEYSYFDLVRANVSYGVDIDDIDARAPGLLDALPPQYAVEQGRPLIDAAWRMVQARLAALKIDTDALRDAQITDELTILAALNVLAVGGWRPAGYDSLQLYIEVTQASFNRFLEQHFSAASPHKIDTGTSGASQPRVATPTWSK